MPNNTSHGSNVLSVPQGDFVLRRLPLRRRELLQPWDAADEYLLRHLAEQDSADGARRTLILNDTFGALAVALHRAAPVAQSDSYLSQAATRLNLEDNGLEVGSVTLIPSTAPLEGLFDRVLIRVPKTMGLLEHQLIRLRAHIHPETDIIATGMVKALPESAWKLMEKIVGPTRPSRAEKKARLIFVKPVVRIPVPDDPYPVEYRLENTGYMISNHANVFSRDSLDIGTRLFLSHLPSNSRASTIVDLGCGNGVVGLVAAERNPASEILFVDESFMAVESARVNFTAAFGQARRAAYFVNDGLDGYAGAPVDLILCNPPFHQQNTVGTQIALRMFQQSARCLSSVGELWVIGNRHLRYERELRRHFKRVERVAEDSKFVISRASGLR